MRLKELRIDAGLTQKSLAAKAGIAREVVARTEGGRTMPEIGTLVKLADALGCSIDEIVGRADPVPDKNILPEQG